MVVADPIEIRATATQQLGGRQLACATSMPTRARDLVGVGVPGNTDKDKVIDMDQNSVSQVGAGACLFVALAALS